MNLMLNGLIGAARQARFFGNQRNRGLYVGGRGLRQAVGVQLLSLSLALGALAAAAMPARAAEPALATVEAVQWPAWIERGGRRQPAAPGLVLQATDRLATGRDGRLLVRLVDGSAVKLGAEAQLQVGGLARPEKGLLHGALDVLRGAFRYTTGVFGKSTYRRDLSVKVATLTIGIRGTDVWGKAADGRDVVLLLEGTVEVAHADGARSLTTPLSYLASSPGAAPEQLTADPAQVEKWAAETELDARRPAGRAKGRFAATVATFADEAAALAAYDKLRALGYPVRLRVIEAPAEASAPAGKTPAEAAASEPVAPAGEPATGAAAPLRQYLLRIENLASRQDAGRLAKALRETLR